TRKIFGGRFRRLTSKESWELLLGLLVLALMSLRNGLNEDLRPCRMLLEILHGLCILTP
ncbi:hypothetical protein H4R99_008677, partial [Coemansia sp. RSA 1722]